MDDEEWMAIKRLTEIGAKITLLAVNQEIEIEPAKGIKAKYKRIE